MRKLYIDDLRVSLEVREMLIRRQLTEPSRKYLDALARQSQPAPPVVIAEPPPPRVCVPPSQDEVRSLRICARCTLAGFGPFALLFELIATVCRLVSGGDPQTQQYLEELKRMSRYGDGDRRPVR
jgi:hypothetical protein